MNKQDYQRVILGTMIATLSFLLLFYMMKLNKSAKPAIWLRSFAGGCQIPRRIGTANAEHSLRKIF